MWQGSGQNRAFHSVTWRVERPILVKYYQKRPRAPSFKPLLRMSSCSAPPKVAAAARAHELRIIQRVGASTITADKLTLQQADGLVGEVWSRCWLHRLVRSSWLAPPGHSLNGPAEFASLRSKYSVNRCAGRRAAKERWLRARSRRTWLGVVDGVGSGGRGG